MKPEPTLDLISHRRQFRRRILLGLALLLIAAGYVALAIPPDAAGDAVIPRGFLGLGLLLAGLFCALLARAVP
jgi:hypothetical protein